jgi:PAS domain S-box-containing protein
VADARSALLAVRQFLRKTARRARRPLSVRSHLVVLVLAALLPVLCFSAAIVVLFNANEREAVEHGLRGTTRALVAAVDRELKSSITSLEALAASKRLAAGELRAFYDDALRALQAQPTWVTISLATPAGEQLVNILQPFGTALPPVADGVKEVARTRRPAVGDLGPEALGDGREFAVRVPVFRDRALTHVLTAVVAPRGMSEVLAEQQLPSVWIGTIVDRTNTIVARTQDAGRFVGASADPLLSGPSAEPPRGWIRGMNREGVLSYVAYARSSFSGWTVALMVPAAVIDAPLERSLGMVAGAGVLFALVGALTASVIGRRIASPLAALSASAAALGRGETPVISASPVAEVDAVARAMETAGRDREKIEAALRDTEERSRLMAERFHALAQLAPIGLFRADADGRYVYVNERWCEITGRAAPEATGDGWQEALHPDDRARVVSEWRDAVPEHRPFASEHRFRRHDGATRFVTAHALPERGANGEAVGYVGAIADVTDRKHAEMERERLLRLEQAARAQAEDAEQRSAFLTHATGILGSSLDYDSTLATVARLAVPRLADMCAVDVVAEDGTIQRVALVHVDPRKEAIARLLWRRDPFDPDATTGTPRVLRTGESEFHPEVSDSLLAARARDPEQLRLFQAIGIKSAMIVPLVARGRSLGAMTFVCGDSDRRYREVDLVLVEGLARRAALAVDNARLYQESERRRREAQELLQAAGALTEDLDLAAVADRIVQRVLPLFRVHSAVLRLLQPEGSLVSVALAGRSRELVEPGDVVPPGVGIVGRAISERRPVWTRDVLRDTRVVLTEAFRRRLEAMGHRAVLAAPLAVKGQIIGVLSLADGAARTFSESEVALLQGLADQAALAVRNVQLFAAEQAARAEAERGGREATVVADLARRINASHDLDAILRSVAESARTLCRCAGVRIAILDAGRDVMVLRDSIGAAPLMNLGFAIERGEGIGGLAWDIGAPVRSADVRRDARFTSEYLPIGEADGIVACMVAPIRIGVRVEGLIYVHDRGARPFTERDEAVLAALADHAAVAVRNAQFLGREQAAREEAEAANRAKDDFLAVLSHELRTPLSAMLGWTRMLRTGLLDAEKVEHALESIERNTQLQAQLINDLLDVSRIIAGKLELERRAVDLGAVIEQAVGSVQPDADTKGIRVETILDGSPAPVEGDPVRLQQVVVNLLTNAVKFTPAGGRVDVRLERDGGSARITVRDTGQGIESDLLPHVFDRFRQGQNPSRASGGLGLGLAIVRHLVELHRGTVRADSAGKGRGAAFTVELPVASDRRLPRRGRAFAARIPAGARDASEVRLDGVQALIVDDHADSLEVVRTALQCHGAEVTAAASVEEAAAVLTRAKIDVLVSDLNLPDADGYDLIRRLRAMERGSGGRAMPAVALTAHASDQDRERALAAGFSAHVAKPVDPGELARVIADAVGEITDD